jgi:phosphotransferase system IIB component
MKKSKIIFLSIITFGIYYFIIVNKAKKQSKEVNSNLLYSTKINFDLNEFISFLGGIENIKSVTNTLSSVGFELNEKIALDKQQYKKFNIKGISQSYNKYIIIFGDNSPSIAMKIKELKSNVSTKI